MNPRPAAARLARRSRRGGFTLVEIMIVILILGVLMNMALPSIVAARDRSQGRACVKNLNNINMAKEQYSMDARLSATDSNPIAWASIAPYMKTVNLPTCPTNNAAYTIGPPSALPSCSYGTSVTGIRHGL